MAICAPEIPDERNRGNVELGALGLAGDSMRDYGSSERFQVNK
jgi:hypothetical protein